MGDPLSDSALLMRAEEFGTWLCVNEMKGGRNKSFFYQKVAKPEHGPPVPGVPEGRSPITQFKDFSEDIVLAKQGFE